MIPAAIQPNVAFIATRAYAAHAYRYYVLDKPVIADSTFDALCKWLLANFDWVKPHDINDYLDREALACGSGFNIAGKVCGQTKDWADALQPPKMEGGIFD